MEFRVALWLEQSTCAILKIAKMADMSHQTQIWFYLLCLTLFLMGIRDFFFSLETSWPLFKICGKKA